MNAAGCSLEFGGPACGAPATVELVVEWDDGTVAAHDYCEAHWRGMARIYAREGVLVEALPIEEGAQSLAEVAEAG